MRIAVLGATGQVGSEVVTEAVRRGHRVLAVSRRPPTADLPPGSRWQQGDASDPAIAAALDGDLDAVVTAFGPPRDATRPTGDFADSVTALVAALGDRRVLVVGGAGSLLDDTGARLLDAPDFPDGYRPEALVHARVLDRLRAADHGNWTYLSPAPALTSGARTGRYVSGRDTPAGPSVSIADLAIAIIDELERDAHRGVRWTVATG